MNEIASCSTSEKLFFFTIVIIFSLAFAKTLFSLIRFIISYKENKWNFKLDVGGKMFFQSEYEKKLKFIPIGIVKIVYYFGYMLLFLFAFTSASYDLYNRCDFNLARFIFWSLE